MLKKILLFAGAGVSVFLIWFAVSDYRDAGPMAEDHLSGLAHSLAAAIENSAVHDPSLRSLATFTTHDIAYFALIDKSGTYRFHSNPDLIGTVVQDPEAIEMAKKGITKADRVMLKTGEEVYEFIAPLYLPGEMLGLRLTLHTYRADSLIRHARFTMLVWLALLVVGWILAIAIYRYASREEQHQRDMLRQESLAQLGEMGAMLAHEIRNPLAGIKGFAQWIEKRPVSENNREHAGRIVSETLRLEKLVEDLLAYARFDEAHIEPFEIADLVTKVLYLIKTEAEGHGVSVAGDCPSGLIVSGNRDRLSQLLLNLCLNGIQAMPDGGSLKISARKTRTGVIIQVSDSGHGINLEDTQHIFEPFFTTKAKGTGLGLAICKKIIVEHNGSISVESNPGTGTTFSITFPATQ